MDFGEEITTDSIKKIRSPRLATAQQTVYIVVEGKMITRMSDTMLLKVFSFIANGSQAPRAATPLHLVSRRFRRLIQSDTFWKNVEVRYPWAGTGVDGDELEEWLHYRAESGIPFFNVQRLAVYYFLTIYSLVSSCIF
jgi:hypothetical protein